jgi:acyl carrier protein
MSDDRHAKVLDIVRRVLGVGAIPPGADFFELGASSLAILQIVDLVNEECGVSVGSADTFDSPDIDSFARLVAAAD